MEKKRWKNLGSKVSFYLILLLSEIFTENNLNTLKYLSNSKKHIILSISPIYHYISTNLIGNSLIIINMTKFIINYLLYLKLTIYRKTSFFLLIWNYAMAFLTELIILNSYFFYILNNHFIYYLIFFHSF